MKSFGSRSFAPLAVVALGALLRPGLVRADDDRLPAAALSSTEASRIQSFHDGRAVPSGDDDTKLLDKEAQWLVYRVTWVEKQTKPKDLSGIVADAFHQIMVPDARKPLKDEQKQYVQALSKPLIVHINNVLKTQRPIARVNAARILARLGETGQENVADALVDVLKDEQQLDAVKFWALRGLRDLFANGFKGGNEKAPPARAGRAVQELIKFLNRKPVYSQAASAEKDYAYNTDEEAFKYLRREAVRALGQSRWPAVAARDAGGNTAFNLLRVVAKEGLTPEPSLSEQTEAVIGLCQLQSKLAPDYQADYAVPFIVQFFNDFVPAYNADKSTMAWKVHAVRLTQALDGMAADTQNAVVKGLATNAKTLLTLIEKGEPADVNRLNDWLKTQTVRDQLYKGDPTSVIKPAAAGG